MRYHIDFSKKAEKVIKKWKKSNPVLFKKLHDLLPELELGSHHHLWLPNLFTALSRCRVESIGQNVAENNGQSMSTNWKRLLKVKSNPLASSTSYSFFFISSFFTVCLG